LLAKWNKALEVEFMGQKTLKQTPSRRVNPEERLGDSKSSETEGEKIGRSSERIL